MLYHGHTPIKEKPVSYRRRCHHQQNRYRRNHFPRARNYFLRCFPILQSPPDQLQIRIPSQNPPTRRSGLSSVSDHPWQHWRWGKLYIFCAIGTSEETPPSLLEEIVRTLVDCLHDRTPIQVHRPCTERNVYRTAYAAVSIHTVASTIDLL